MKVLLTFILLLSQATLYAQLLPLNTAAYTDSLQHIISGSHDDSLKAQAYMHLSNYYIDADSALAASYLQEAKPLIGNSNYLRALHHFYSGSLLEKGDAALSESLYLKADSLLLPYNTKKAYEARYAIWKNYGRLQQLKNREDDFMQILSNQCIPLAKKAANTELLGESYVNIGIILMNQVQYERAASYFNKAIRLYKEHPPGNKAYFTYAYENASQNALYQADLKQGKQFLDKLKELLTPFPESSYWITYYNNEGIYYRKSKQYQESLKSLDKGIAQARKLDRPYQAESLLFLKCLSYSEMEDYPNARKTLLYLIKHQTYPFAENRLRYYYYLADTYHELNNNAKAYEWQTKALELLDSLYESDVRNNVNELEVKYQMAEKEKEILLLEKQKLQAELSAKNHRLYSWLLGACCLFFLALGGFSFLLYKKNKKISRQHLKEMEQQQELRLSQAMLEGEDRERKRVARDLHDGLGGMLAGIKMKLSGEVKEEFSDHEGIENVITQLDSSIVELRRIARNMMPEVLVRFGLETALKELCESLNSKQTTVDYAFYQIDSNIELNTQIAIYRIIQELLSNAVKHAEARNIYLQCSQNSNMFLITIEDDGRGFDTSILKNKKGIGLRNIENRVHYLKGKMELSSLPNDGTTINIEIDVAA